MASCSVVRSWGKEEEGEDVWSDGPVLATVEKINPISAQTSTPWQKQDRAWR